MTQLFYTTYISVDLAHYEISSAKVGKGGIINYVHFCQKEYDPGKTVLTTDMTKTNSQKMFLFSENGEKNVENRNT